MGPFLLLLEFVFIKRYFLFQIEEPQVLRNLVPRVIDFHEFLLDFVHSNLGHQRLPVIVYLDFVELVHQDFRLDPDDESGPSFFNGIIFNLLF